MKYLKIFLEIRLHELVAWGSHVTKLVSLNMLPGNWRMIRGGVYFLTNIRGG